jgi:hypothetical protein
VGILFFGIEIWFSNEYARVLGVWRGYQKNKRWVMIKFSFEFTAGVLHEEITIVVEYTGSDQFEITMLTGTEVSIQNSIGMKLTAKQFADLTNMFIAVGRAEQIVI